MEIDSWDLGDVGGGNLEGRNLGGTGRGNHGEPEVFTGQWYSEKERDVGKGPADVRSVNGAREKESYCVAVMLCVYTKGWAQVRERLFRF